MRDEWLRGIFEMDDWELRREMKKKKLKKKKLERVRDLRIYEGGRCKLERGEWKAKKLSENKDVRFLGCCGVKSSLELNILNIIFHLNFYFLIFQKTHIRYIKFHLKKKKWCGIRCYASFVLMQNIFLFSIKFGWWEQDSGCSNWSY